VATYDARYLEQAKRGISLNIPTIEMTLYRADAMHTASEASMFQAEAAHRDTSGVPNRHFERQFFASSSVCTNKGRRRFLSPFACCVPLQRFP
jgi:hypothetical protein